MYIAVKDVGHQSVTVLGLHQFPGIASQKFGNLAYFVRIHGNLLEFPYQESLLL